MKGINANTGDTVYDAVEVEKRSQTGFEAAVIEAGEVQRFADGEAVAPMMSLNNGELAEFDKTTGDETEVLLALINKGTYGTELVFSLEFKDLSTPVPDGDEDSQEMADEELNEVDEPSEGEVPDSGIPDADNDKGSSGSCRTLDGSAPFFGMILFVLAVALIRRRVENQSI